MYEGCFEGEVENMNTNYNDLPLIPLRELVVIPGSHANIDIGRKQSIAAVEEAMRDNHHVVLSMQKNIATEDPTFDEIYKVGVVAKITQVVRLPGGIRRIYVSGKERVVLKNIISEDDYKRVAYEQYPVTEYPEDPEVGAKLKTCRERYIEHMKHTDEDRTTLSQMKTVISRMGDIGEITDFIVDNLTLPQKKKQSFLEITDGNERLDWILDQIAYCDNVMAIEAIINEKLNDVMSKQQKEYLLREKLKVIRGELGEAGDASEEAEEFREKLAALNLPESIEKVISKEIARYEKTMTMTPESSTIRTYIERVLELPWNKESEDRLNIKEAKVILDEDHFGLEKVKERILESLAVRQLSNDAAGTILCLVGPPGVGKTSLAKSVAKAMDREFVCVALGGVSDESEIRGHRRTYIGSMPGRMIAGMTKAGTKNPVFLLDEIDKISSHYKGDPAAALLEVLDPEQNDSFTDHYIDVPFDFSNVFWITTANVAGNIPEPLWDRMEVIEISSYTEDEKVEIAKRYLIPKQVKKTGLPSDYTLSEKVLRKIISEYTREAGVRNLEKTIGKIFRRLAYEKVNDNKTPKRITPANLKQYLGVSKYVEDENKKIDTVGLVCGLAWTSIGGVVLPCEVATMDGTGKLILTGSLGDVMKESAQAAESYIRSNAKELKIDGEFHKNKDIHIHLPEGATPKDGPSAGITMTVAIVSALTNRKVRHDIAMTGEITIRGDVLPIGGLKEKLLAALRFGVKEVLIPQGNVKDIEELPQAVRKGLTITPVKTMGEVLEKALVD